MSVIWGNGRGATAIAIAQGWGAAVVIVIWGEKVVV